MLFHAEFAADFEDGSSGDVVELAELVDGCVVLLGDFREGVTLLDRVPNWAICSLFFIVKE